MKKKLIDKKLILFLSFFYIVSIICIKSASSYTKISLGNLVLKQSIWYLIGIGIIILIYHLKNEFLYKYSIIFYSF